MTKSIEDIWKEGFIDNGQNLAPKVNDLYALKSKHIVDKLKKMYDLNVKAILIGMPLALLGLSLAGLPILGVGMAILLGWIAKEATPFRKAALELEMGQNCYDYIIRLQAWRHSAVARFEKVYSLFYPLLFLIGVVQFIHSEIGGMVLKSLSEGATMVGPFPLSFLIAIAIMGAIVALLARPLYRLDMSIVYGKEFARLDDLLDDMKALNREK